MKTIDVFLGNDTVIIERIHVQPVYVSTEPPVEQPDRLEELEKSVKDVVSQMNIIGETYNTLSARVKALEDAARPKTEPSQPTETNLEKAKRLYPKGTKFKTLGHVEYDVVSSGEFKELHGYIYDAEHKSFVFNGQWAEIIPAKPTAWRLKIDVPEWGLKKGQESIRRITHGQVWFYGGIGDYYFPLSIMPHIAEEVEG